jgi:prepilin-type N-terminal cleavage/methylation domain-containing protein
MRLTQHTAYQRQAGLSLFELLVAMVIVALIKAREEEDRPHRRRD